MPLHSSLGNKSETPYQKKKKTPLKDTRPEATELPDPTQELNASFQNLKF